MECIAQQPGLPDLVPTLPIREAAASPQRCAFYLVLAAVVALFWLADVRRSGSPRYDLDDPYITLHNAQVILAGQDANYRGVPPLAGTTSAIHLLLVTGLSLLVPSVWALQAANWLAVLAYALGIARLAFQHRATAWQAALLVAAGLIVAEVPCQLLNGLETGLAMAALVWALVAATTARPNRFLPILCGLMPFVRPELALIAVLLMLVQWQRRREAGQTGRALGREIALDAALAVGVALPWLLWYECSTGLPYPATMQAKRLFFSEGLLPAQAKNNLTLQSLERFCLFLGCLGWAIFMLGYTRLGRLGLAFVIAFVGVYYTLFPGALWQNQQRYLYLLLPLLLYGVASWLASPREGPRFAATCLLIAVLLQSALFFPVRWGAFTIRRDLMTRELVGVTGWCREHLPAHSRLLIHDAGYIACTTPFPLTDMVGLKSPASILEHQAYTWPSAGRGRAEAVRHIAAGSRSEYLVVTQEWDRLYGLTEGLRRGGWRVKELRTGGFYRVYGLGRGKEAPGFQP